MLPSFGGLDYEGARFSGRGFASIRFKRWRTFQVSPSFSLGLGMLPKLM
ncbi:MAG: hypothetical protein R3E32_18080 [Chitinophagales bacterium]